MKGLILREKLPLERGQESSSALGQEVPLQSLAHGHVRNLLQVAYSTAYICVPMSMHRFFEHRYGHLVQEMFVHPRHEAKEQLSQKNAQIVDG